MATRVPLLCLILAVCASVVRSSFIYLDNDLGQTVSVVHIDRRQKKELRQEVLSLLGLHSTPAAAPNEDLIQSASEFMQGLYRSIEDDSALPFPADSTRIHISSKVNATALGLDPAKVEGADIIASFINNAQKASTLRREQDMTFYFEVPPGEQINVAELRIFKEISPVFNQGRFVINLYAIKPGRDRRERTLALESTLDVDWDTRGWLILDATKAAANWTTIPHLNLGMYLRIVDARGRMRDPQDVGLVGRKGPANKQSFLVGYIDMPKETMSSLQARRKKRWTEGIGKSQATNPYSYRPSTESSSSEDKCQRRKLYINFRDIGFDQKFLISPDGYSAFYCSGMCLFPLDESMNASNHAILQTLVHLMDPELAPAACCAPDQFGSIPFLYFDTNNTLVIRNIPNMVVRSCGCF
ncbi:hypothetical protein BsWGS_24243 [Bradybaena similaris]